MFCYSSNGEDFSYDSVEDALDGFYPTNGESEKKVIIWEAEAVPKKASEYFDVDSAFERMDERAHEDMGDFSEGWIQGIDNNYAEKLKAAIVKTIDEWANETGNNPTFFGVEDIKKVEYVLNDKGEYERAVAE